MSKPIKIKVMQTEIYGKNKIILGRYRNMMSIFNCNKGMVKPQECGVC